jgi:hypothetical protein
MRPSITLISNPFFNELTTWLRRLTVWLGFAAVAFLSACGGGSGGGVPDTPVIPTLTISSNAGEEASEPFTVTFAFSAPVTINHASGILQLASTNCTPVPNTFAKTGAATYTMVVNPHAGKKGIAEIRLAPGTFKDSTGTVANTLSYEFAQAFNTIGPIATFDQPGVLFITGPSTVRISFDAVLDATLTIDKLTASVGTVSDLVKTSAPGANDSYTFTFTPPAATLGTVIIQLPSGSVAAGGIASGTAQQWGPYAIKTP